MSTENKRTSIQIQRDRLDIADWYCQGLTQAAIAERINVSEDRDYTLTQQMISYDLKRIQEFWLTSSLRDFDEMRAEQLGKIDRLEREYWRGWESSCKDAETIVKKQKEDGGKEQQKTSKGQAGDPRFLAGIDKCIERRCKLLGLDAPKQLEIYDWRKEIKEYGIDPDAALDSLTSQFVKAMQGSDAEDGVRASKENSSAAE